MRLSLAANAYIAAPCATECMSLLLLPTFDSRRPARYQNSKEFLLISSSSLHTQGFDALEYLIAVAAMWMKHLLLANTIPWTEAEGVERILLVICKGGFVQPALRDEFAGPGEVGWVTIYCPLPNSEDSLSGRQSFSLASLRGIQTPSGIYRPHIKSPPGFASRGKAKGTGGWRRSVSLSTASMYGNLWQVKKLISFSLLNEDLISSSSFLRTSR